MKRLLIYFILFLLILATVNDSKLRFTLLSVLVTAGAVTEMVAEFRKHRINVLLSPYFICLIFMFVVNLGISNFIYLYTRYDNMISTFLLDNFPNSKDYYYWLSRSQMYVFAGFMALVAGYKTEARTLFISNISAGLFQTKRLLVKGYNLNLGKILALWLISVAIKTYAIYLGVYGFTASALALEKYKGIVQFLLYSSALSKGSLFFLSVLYFREPSKKHRAMLILMLLIETFFGLLAGFKSQVMFPFIIVFFAYIIVYKKVSFKFLIPVILSLWLAYALVEPMRNASYGYGSDQKTNMSELVEIASAGVKAKDVNTESAYPFLYVLMFRNTLTVYIAIAMRQVEVEHRHFPQFRINEKIFLSPVLAYIPRALWKDKPVINDGGTLYNKDVLGTYEEDNTSIAISPIGFFILDTPAPLLYTIAFFFILGGLQYFVFGLYRNYGFGGLIVCIGMLSIFGLIEEPYSVFVAYFKELPILVVFQYLFLFKTKKDPAAAAVQPAV